MLEELANFDDHLLEELQKSTLPKKSSRLKAGIGSRFGGACLLVLRTRTMVRTLSMGSPPETTAERRVFL